MRVSDQTERGFYCLGFIKVVLDPITIDDTTQSKIRDIETPSTNTIYVV